MININKLTIDLKKISNTWLSFAYSLLYVSIGILLGFLYWTDYNPIHLNEVLGIVLYLLFFPSSFPIVMLFYFERDPYNLILIIEILIFLIIWVIIFSFISLFRT